MRKDSELMPILKWLNGQFPSKFAARLDDKVQNIEGSRKIAAFRTNTQDIIQSLLDRQVQKLPLILPRYDTLDIRRLTDFNHIGYKTARV